MPAESLGWGAEAESAQPLGLTHETNHHGPSVTLETCLFSALVRLVSTDIWVFDGVVPDGDTLHSLAFVQSDGLEGIYLLDLLFVLFADGSVTRFIFIFFLFLDDLALPFATAPSTHELLEAEIHSTI